MGLLYTPFQVFDANGDPLGGALLYFYDASATTTPKATYTTNALSVANSNPLEADSAGRFGQAFAETGEGYYIVLKTAEDETVASWADVTALGEDDAGTFQRTFADARLKISSGEVDGASTEGVIYEAGPASPDNTGGFALFRGWDGTQAQLIKFDAAQAEFTGAVSFGGPTTGEVTTVSALDIDLSQGNFFKKSISSNSTFTFSNTPTDAGQVFALELTISSSAVPTWPASVDHGNGSNPSSSLGNGRHILTFITFNAGTDWTMAVYAQAAA